MPVDAGFRRSSFHAGAVEYAFEEAVEHLSDASGAFGKMLGRAMGWALTVVQLSFERPIAPARSVSLLLGPQACQMAFPTFREGI